MYGHPREYFIGKTPAFLSAPGTNDLAATPAAIQRAFAGEPRGTMRHRGVNLHLRHITVTRQPRCRHDMHLMPQRQRLMRQIGGVLMHPEGRR
jgi:hypothetical protein